MVSLSDETVHGGGLCFAASPQFFTYSRLRAFSAFDMLRYPNLRTADFIKVIPELATIDPRILSRIDIDGVSCHI
jgi:hypothetical protein